MLPHRWLRPESGVGGVLPLCSVQQRRKSQQHNGAWRLATQVLAMLDKAKRMIDEGRMTAEELDRNLTLNLQVDMALQQLGLQQLLLHRYP
jgi:hypothetical protein